MNKRELKKLKKIRDKLAEMMESEKNKLENLNKIGSSRDKMMKVNRASVSLEMAVDCLNDLL